MMIGLEGMYFSPFAHKIHTRQPWLSILVPHTYPLSIPKGLDETMHQFINSKSKCSVKCESVCKTAACLRAVFHTCIHILW